MFADRTEAGRLLGEELRRRGRQKMVVLGIPRGGVIVAASAAAVAGAPLDVAVTRKIRAPHNPELGLGAVAPDVVFLEDSVVEGMRIHEGYLQEEIELQRREVERRAELYRGGRPPVELEGRTAVVVDDGIATGGTAVAALRWARARAAARVVMAVPVGPSAARALLEPYADEVVMLMEPDDFWAVGQWYADFTQTTDEEVIEALARASTPNH